MTGVQTCALPIFIPGETLEKLRQEPGVVYAAPIGFGDRLGRNPIVGSSTDLLTRGGTAALPEGRVFASDHEAVVGAAVGLKVGAEFAAQHGMASEADDDDDDHDAETPEAHAGFKFTVVGRMAPTGTPWDQAIIVPIEAVWQVHGFNNGHAAGVTRIGPPWESADAPGVPAIVVKPRTVSDAYRLRGKYRTGGTMALFPAEVLVEIYAAMVDAMDTAVGRVLDAVKGIGRLDNTDIIFFSDNGPSGTLRETSPGWQEWIVEKADNRFEKLGTKDSYVSIGPRWAQAQAAPYFLFKRYTSEGGVRTCALACGPRVKARRESSAFLHVMDVAPTLLAFAGVQATTSPGKIPMRGV